MSVKGFAPRPASRGADGQAGNGPVQPVWHHSTPTPSGCQAVLRFRNRIVAKLVIARPLDQLVLAQPYRHRPLVSVVSQNPAVLDHARRARVQLWVVRDDRAGQCWALDLATVEKVGWLHRHRDGHLEVFVPLATFRPIPWQDWSYITGPVVDLDEPATDQAAQQLALPGFGGER